MELFPVLFALAIILTVVTIVGHIFWLICAASLRAVFGSNDALRPNSFLSDPSCDNCNRASPFKQDYCPYCGYLRLQTLRSDLEATERQLTRFRREQKISETVYFDLQRHLDSERWCPRTSEGSFESATSTTLEAEKENREWKSDFVDDSPPPIVTSVIVDPPASVIEPSPTFLSQAEEIETAPKIEPDPPVEPRRRFTEMLNAFMEESNIRWGEVIGGLLIIGCSTALVVSLWSQISQIPVAKFLIFTTVTAVLFGIGLYTEHRWKLPNTSRGILTIATLLVPLNFLAIAAVSSGPTSDALIIASEILAPALFLTLVYYAGRVITPRCAALLSSGILLSSIGQLLIRHFGSADIAPELLVALGAFPIVCHTVALGLSLRLVLQDGVIDEQEARTTFTMLGTLSFAALLPFGLLLYKAGPLPMTMVYLAPIVTLSGVPLLSIGAVLWRRIQDRRLLASRTTGTALAILGAIVVLAGVFLAWPNPASIVPAALLSFVAFTGIALALDLPLAHSVAALCLTLAYTVSFHVISGEAPWINLRVMSLWNLMLSVETGQAMVGTFFVFFITSTWFEKRGKNRDSLQYLLAASVVAVFSLGLVSTYGLSSALVPYHIWIVYLAYSFGAFWIAWHRGWNQFTWVGSALLLFALVQAFAQILDYSFPWQTALLLHATLSALFSIVLSKVDESRVLRRPLARSALASTVLGVICLFQANTWQVTDMQARRVFWIAGILLLLLWSYRKQLLFVCFQMAVTTGLILTVKAALQASDWYSYLPHVFLHPRGLQIQATVLLLLGLVWIVLRLLCRSLAESNDAGHWSADAWRLLNARYCIDRLFSWSLLAAFVVFAIYGSASGVTQELVASGSDYAGFNLAGFPREEVLGLGSWIVLGLLMLTMFAHAWERRRSIFVVAATVVAAMAVPLLAGLFEPQIATASAWRFLAIIFLLLGSVVLWGRSKIWQRLKGFGWPALNNGEALTQQLRAALFIVTLMPIVLLTIYPSLRAIYYLPVRGPQSGIYSYFDIDFLYSFPLAVVALILVGHALRERKAEFALAAGAFLNFTVTVGYLLSVVAVGGLMDRIVLVRVIQFNAIAAGLYAIAWLKYERSWMRGLSQSQERSVAVALQVQIALVLGLNLLLMLPAVSAIFLLPALVGVGTLEVGSLLGWIAIGICLAAFVWSRSNEPVSAEPLATLLVAVASMLAVSVASSNVEMFAGLHCLTIGIIVVAWLLFLGSTARTQKFLSQIMNLHSSWQSSSKRYAIVFGIVATGFALRPGLGDPSSDWWGIVPLLALCGLAVAMHHRTLRRKYLIAAAALFLTAGSIWWLSYLAARFPGTTALLLASVTMVSISAIVWLWFELRARIVSPDVSKTASHSLHHVLAILSFITFTGLVLQGLSFNSGESPLLYFPSLTWLAFASVVALFVACLWDRHARYAPACLYLLGAICCGVVVQQLALDSLRTAWVASVFFALLALGSSMLWWQRRTLLIVAARLRIPTRIVISPSELNWLAAFNVVTVGVLIGLAFRIILQSSELDLRLSSAFTVAIQAFTFALLATGPLRLRWQRIAIVAVLIGGTFFGWAWLNPGSNGTWLNRATIVAAAALLITALITLSRKRFSILGTEWTTAVRACMPWILFTGLQALFFCLVDEVAYQLNFGVVRIHLLSFWTILLSFLCANVLFLHYAISAGNDPLKLTERHRILYVYAAELMLTLLFVHVRLTMPWLFGSLEPYWPFIVMAIAYTGAIISETLHRRQLQVFANPVEITATFLPLLPLLGFWILDSDVDYSALLFVIGGFYGLLTLLRRSFRCGVMAAVCGNAGLWYYLQRTDDYQFLQHPQMWLVPVALSVLLAAYLNRKDFTEDQLTTTRYLALVMIYSSSTADIVINGVSNSPWLPLILATFSLAGIFSGILLRIRGMLVLGSLFLLFAIVTMIWYASVNFGWTWLWYVAGIVTGATIIFMFAVFEKKRSEVLRLVDELRDWDR